MKKNMGWGFFLVVAIISGLVMLELLVWLGPILQREQVKGAITASKDFLTVILSFLALTAAIATIHWLHQIALAPTQIVIEPFRKALRDGEIEKYQLTSLALEVREHLARDLERIGKWVEVGVTKRGPYWYQAPFSVIPSFSHRIPEFIEHHGGYLQDATESLPIPISDTSGASQQVGLPVPLSGALFRRRSIRISCSLHKDKIEEISFEIASRASNKMPRIGRIRYSKEMSQSDVKEPIDRYESILPYVSKILAIEICKEQMLDHLKQRD